MRLELSTKLQSSPDRVRQEVLTSRLMQYVTYPLATYVAINPTNLPEIWTAGDYLVKIRLLGIVPFGKHFIKISIPNPTKAGGEYLIRDNGRGDFISKWDHLISIRSADDGGTQYSDAVEVKAGILTPFVWLYALIFYHYRQLRWKRLIASDFHYPSM